MIGLLGGNWIRVEVTGIRVYYYRQPFVLGVQYEGDFRCREGLVNIQDCAVAQKSFPYFSCKMFTHGKFRVIWRTSSHVCNLFEEHSFAKIESNHKLLGLVNIEAFPIKTTHKKSSGYSNAFSELASIAF